MIEVTDRELVPADIVGSLKKDRYGAIVTFLGIVRDFDDGRRLAFLEYEAFKDMAEKKLQEVGELVRARWNLEDVALCHRTGRLQVGEISLVAVVAAPHRREAFEACDYAVDTLKEIVPIWKKEIWDGGSEWVQGEDA